MSTLASGLIAKAQQACVGYYHRCTVFDDWGTSPEHWLQVECESPAQGFLNRYFIRVNPENDGKLEHRKDELHLADRTRGVMVVTFLRGNITDTEWYMRPSGGHAYPGENYKNREDEAREQNLAEKPDGYGDWA